jgi:hypothetical protein
MTNKLNHCSKVRAKLGYLKVKEPPEEEKPAVDEERNTFVGCCFSASDWSIKKFFSKFVLHKDPGRAGSVPVSSRTV